jgi:epoxyqueuosine reductase QueG
MDSNHIKQILYDFGTDICGIASIDRFDKSPEGFHQ